MVRTKISASRPQAPRPADNILSLLNRIRVLEERETHFGQALQAAMDEAQTMETSLRARIAQLESYQDTMHQTIDHLYATDAELRKDNARLQNEVLLRVSRLNRAPEQEADSESDTDYEPGELESESEPDSESEPEPERPWLQDVYASIDDTGNRAQRFRGILRKIVQFPNYDINEVYNEVLGTDRYRTDCPLQKEDIHPNFWTALGRNEDEKKENAKKVVELLYRRPY